MYPVPVPPCKLTDMNLTSHAQCHIHCCFCPLQMLTATQQFVYVQLCLWINEMFAMINCQVFEPYTRSVGNVIIRAPHMDLCDLPSK